MQKKSGATAPNSYLKSENGVVAVVAALMMPVLMGMGGVAVDAGSWFMEQRNLQTAADAAALAVAYEYANDPEVDINAIALREAVHNGFDEEGTIEVVMNDVHDDGSVSFAVDLSQDANLWFSRVFMASVTVGTGATSEVGAGAGGMACILSLDNQANQALKTSGNVTINMPECGMAVNSDSDTALYLNGNVNINVGDVSIHGDYDVAGNSATFEYNSIKTSATQVEDPYADLNVPTYAACSSTNKRKGNKYTANTTLNPGVYCGGITISGNTTVTFRPGVYILDGGDFKVTGNGSMTGSGVSFVLTNSASAGGKYGSLNISGGRRITFTAPTSGNVMEGVAFYQDRNAPSSASNSITGTADIFVSGASYFPAAEITYGGNAGSTSDSQPCSRVIGRIVTMHGTPDLANSCVDSAARDIDIPGAGSVRLIQ
ncbi:MAG: hypothetical protein EBQ96_09225 [Proteobacteria bacterium]|nr:hypothetical protein [Pseudomonadota bacterium]